MAETGRCPACGREVRSGAVHACVEGPTLKGASASAAPHASDPSLGPHVGAVLGDRYELRAKAGEGGGGMVFRAWDRELDTEVALKIVPPGEISAGFIDRLKREIRITRAIDHPHVSRVFDLFQSDGLTFFTMRWIDGEALGDRVRRAGPLGPAELRRLAAGLVSALAEVHRRGIVHRDVKPGNVLVSAAGDPVLVDFGIANDEGSSRGSSSRHRRLTPDGVVPGTPKYMAPEQKKGDASAASDLWALAITLAFAATGDPSRPASPAKTFEGLGRALRAEVVRCLASDPAQRPHDAVALERAVRRAETRRRAGWIAVAALAVIGLAAGVGLWVAKRAEQGLGRTAAIVRVEPLSNATGDASLDWLSHGVAELVSSGLEASGRVRFAEDAASLGRAARIAGSIERNSGAIVVDLSLRRSGLPPMHARVRDPTGPSLFEGTESAVRRFLGALGVRTAKTGARVERPTADAVAFAHYARGEDLLRRYHYEDALAELQMATDRDPGFALAQLERFVVGQATGQGSRSAVRGALAQAGRHEDRLPPSRREYLAAVLEIDRADSEPASFDRLLAYLRSHPPEATTYRMAVRLGLEVPEAAARNRIRRAIAEEWSRRLPDDGEAHNQLGYILMLDFEDSAAAEREFLAYRRLSPGVANAHDSYGDFLAHYGRYREAIREYDRAVEIDPSFGMSAVHAAEAALRTDDLTEVERRIPRARQLASPESRDWVGWVQLDAALPLLRGDVARSLAVLEAIAIDPSTGARAAIAREYQAIVLGLRGDGRRARTAAAAAGQLSRLYHGASVGESDLAPYVDGLAAFARGRQPDVVAARARFHPASLRDSARPAVLEGLVSILRGDPSAAAEALVVERPPIDAREGSRFFASLLRARALASAGRVLEASVAYDETVTRRQSTAATPEAAFAWRACLEEAADLARRRGEADRATELDARRAMLDAPAAR